MTHNFNEVNDSIDSHMTGKLYPSSKFQLDR